MTRHAPTSLYSELTTRNRGFVSDAAQERLRTATVLVAGCGSTGGASVEPLVRLGVQAFLLADNGSYELNNLNRQAAYLDEIGANKAAVCAQRVEAVNPEATTEVHTDGIQPHNVGSLVGRSDVVIDGVDVTERAGWLAKYTLHEAAARLGKPVITGYDMAGTQYVRFYDYRRAGTPFDGRLTRRQVETMTTWGLLRRVVPMRTVPVELLDTARRAVAHGEETIPQVVYASLLFAAISSRMVVDVLGDRPVRRHTLINVDRAVHPATVNVRDALRKPLVALLALKDLAVTERHASRT